MNSPAVSLTSLARALETRWRVQIFLEVLVSALLITVTVSLAVSVLDLFMRRDLPLVPTLLLANGGGVVAALFVAALRRRSAQELLGAADRAYNTHSLLSSAFEFAANSERISNAAERQFRALVVKQGDEVSSRVDPASVFPLHAPRRSGIVLALAAATVIAIVLGASGLLTRSEPALAAEGALLEENARQLAERAEQDELRDLAEEIRRLGERLRTGQIDADEARRRIDQLGEKVEEQLRNLDRLDSFETNQDMEIPPEAEETIRQALSSGMSEGEVTELFMRARSEGSRLPDMLEMLEEATSDRPPDANLGLDEEEVKRLLEQLNLPTNPETESDVTRHLESARGGLREAGRGLAELTPGDESEMGETGDRGTGRGPAEEEREPTPGEGGESDQSGTGGNSAGEQPVPDAMTDTFARIEDASPVFREIEGVVGQGTIRDVIIRELPSEAVSRLSEEDREVAFQRVIEEAVGRENTPVELQRLVRNYFLRITLGEDEGEEDEQQ